MDSGFQAQDRLTSSKHMNVKLGLLIKANRSTTGWSFNYTSSLFSYLCHVLSRYWWNTRISGAVVRALASHQCGPGSFPWLGVICGLSLLVLYSAPRGFLRVLRFPLSSKTRGGREEVLQGYPQHFRRYLFIHLGGHRHRESKVSCPRTQHNVPGQGPNPDDSIRGRAHMHWPWGHRAFQLIIASNIAKYQFYDFHKIRIFTGN